MDVWPLKRGWLLLMRTNSIHWTAYSSFCTSAHLFSLLRCCSKDIQSLANVWCRLWSSEPHHDVRGSISPAKPGYVELGSRFISTRNLANKWKVGERRCAKKNSSTEVNVAATASEHARERAIRIVQALKTVPVPLLGEVLVKAAEHTGLSTFPPDLLAELACADSSRFSESMVAVLTTGDVALMRAISNALGAVVPHVSLPNLILALHSLTQLEGVDAGPLLAASVGQLRDQYEFLQPKEILSLSAIFFRHSTVLTDKLLGRARRFLLLAFVKNIWTFEPNTAVLTLFRFTKIRQLTYLRRSHLKELDAFFASTGTSILIENLVKLADSFNRLGYFGEKMSDHFARTLILRINEVKSLWSAVVLVRQCRQPLSEEVLEMILQDFARLCNCNLVELAINFSLLATCLTLGSARVLNLSQQIGRLMANKLAEVQNVKVPPVWCCKLLYSLNALSASSRELNAQLLGRAVSDTASLNWASFAELVRGVSFAAGDRALVNMFVRHCVEFSCSSSAMTLRDAVLLAFGFSAIQVVHTKVLSAVVDFSLRNSFALMMYHAPHLFSILSSLCRLSLSPAVMLKFVQQPEFGLFVPKLVLKQQIEILMWCLHYNLGKFILPSLATVMTISTKDLRAIDHDGRYALAWLSCFSSKSEMTAHRQLSRKLVQELHAQVSSDVQWDKRKLLCLDTVAEVLNSSRWRLHYCYPFVTPEGVAVDMAISILGPAACESETGQGQLMATHRQVAVLVLRRVFFSQVSKDLLGLGQAYCRAVETSGWQVLVLPLFEFEHAVNKMAYIRKWLIAIGMDV